MYFSQKYEFLGCTTLTDPSNTTSEAKDRVVQRTLHQMRCSHQFCVFGGISCCLKYLMIESTYKIRPKRKVNQFFATFLMVASIFTILQDKVKIY